MDNLAHTTLERQKFKAISNNVPCSIDVINECSLPAEGCRSSRVTPGQLPVAPPRIAPR